MALEVLTHQVQDEETKRLDQIVQSLTGRSRADVRGLFDNGCVKINGHLCKTPGRQPSPEDVIVVTHDPHTRYREAPKPFKDPAFQLIYEDDSLLVVNKSAGILSVPTDHGGGKNLVGSVDKYLKHIRCKEPAAAVHRLDRWTSGILVFGKGFKMGKMLQDQFKERKAEREYAAIVAGIVDDDSGKIVSRLSTTKLLQRYSAAPGEGGEIAITHYQVVKRLKGATYMRVQLETGRRNQIRVHFAEKFHPVLGDDRYRPKLAKHPRWPHRRLALHAAVLGFDHPKTGEALRFEAPLPKEFANFLK